jgi:hypothetical protein
MNLIELSKTDGLTYKLQLVGIVISVSKTLNLLLSANKGVENKVRKNTYFKFIADSYLFCITPN